MSRARKTIGYLLYVMLRQGLSLISCLIPKNKRKILFFSSPDYSDNAKYIYEKMIEMKLERHFQLIWAVHKPIEANCVLRGTPMYFYHILTAKYIIATHGIPYWKASNQIAIFTEHGLPFKASGYLSRLPFEDRISLNLLSKRVDYILSTSQFHAILLSAIYRVDPARILITGWPRQDGLFNEKSEQAAAKVSIYKKRYDKVILYAPTFRESRRDDLSSTLLESNEFIRFLCANNILCAYKPHKNVDIGELESRTKDSSILVLKDEDLSREGLHLYDFLAVFDLIITDYSSIFYDAALLDIPVIFYMPDLQHYRVERGFLFSPDRWLPGHIVESSSKMADKIEEVFRQDPHKERREFIRDLMFEVHRDCSRKVINRLFPVVTEDRQK